MKKRGAQSSIKQTACFQRSQGHPKTDTFARHAPKRSAEREPHCHTLPKVCSTGAPPRCIDKEEVLCRKRGEPKGSVGCVRKDYAPSTYFGCKILDILSIHPSLIIVTQSKIPL